MRLIRSAALLAALLLVSAIAAPSVGAFQENVNNGKTGFYTVPDDAFSPGAVCRYENNPGKFKDETNKVRARMVWTHGPFAMKSWVGHRMIVLKRANASMKWSVAWKSPITKARANQVAVATFGGKRWLTPERHKKQYRVVHQFTYYAKGSKTKVVGTVRGAVEVYKHALAWQAPYLQGQEGGLGGWCKKRFWPVP